MAAPSFRDRFFTPPVAGAVLSPWSLALAAAVAVVGFALGLPLVGAVALGLVAYAGRVLVAVPRVPRPERIDPFTVQEPWRRFVQDAVKVRNRFDEAVHGMTPGPLQDNLHDVAGRVHAAAAESFRVAQRGEALDQARRRIDVRAIERQRAQLAGAPDGDGTDGGTDEGLARPDGPGDTPAGDPVADEVVRSLDAQQASAERLDRVVADAQARLRLLDARLDEALARAIEVSAHSGSTEALGTLGPDVDSVVTDLEALRLALEETHGTPGGLSAPGGAP